MNINKSINIFILVDEYTAENIYNTSDYIKLLIDLMEKFLIEQNIKIFRGRNINIELDIYTYHAYKNGLFYKSY